MAQDTQTKLVLAVIVILAIIGVVFLFRSGTYQYKLAGRERPGYLYSGECCTCTRAQLTLQGAVRPETHEVLFRNAVVDDCTAACGEAHEYSKRPYMKYNVNALVTNDPVCRESLPVPRSYAGAGGFSDQPTSDSYYVAR